MRSRFVIPAALLVTVAYVKGRLDANLGRQGEIEEVPVATPPVDPILRAQAEAEDAMVISQAQAAAAAVEVEVEDPAPDVAHLSEWLSTPTLGPAPRRRESFDLARLAEWATNPVPNPPRRPRPRPSFDPARMAEWMTDPAPRPTRHLQPDEFDPAALAEWATTPTWGPLRRVAARDILDAAALLEWASDPTWSEIRRARTRDAFEAAALVEWVTHVAPPAPVADEVPVEAPAEAPAPTVTAEAETAIVPLVQPEAVATGAVIEPLAEAPPEAARPAPVGEPPVDPEDEVPMGALVEFGPAIPVASPLEEPAEIEPVVAHDADDEAEAEAGHETEPVVEPEAEPAPAAGSQIVIDESGRFSLGGWAAQPGHMVLTGVTFRDRRDRPVDPSAIRLRTDALSNVGEGGLVVLTDSGFAPDREGFTILLAAEGPGSFAAAGVYEVAATEPPEALAA